MYSRFCKRIIGVLCLSCVLFVSPLYAAKEGEWGASGGLLYHSLASSPAVAGRIGPSQRAVSLKLLRGHHSEKRANEVDVGATLSGFLKQNSVYGLEALCRYFMNHTSVTDKGWLLLDHIMGILEIPIGDRAEDLLSQAGK